MARADISLAALGFNLTLAVVHVLGLMRTGEQLGVGDLLFREGVVYYLAAFTFNAVPAVSISVPFSDPVSLIVHHA